MKRDNKSQVARDIGVSRQLLYYHHKQKTKDWRLKTEIEEALHEHPSYGHKRLAIHLKVNRKRILRVMVLSRIVNVARNSSITRQREIWPSPTYS